MSVPFGPFILTLDDMTKRMRSTFEGFTDPRQGKNTTYTLVDAALSAFAVFFLQSPSFLEYPRSLEQTRGKQRPDAVRGPQHPLGQPDPHPARRDRPRRR